MSDTATTTQNNGPTLDQQRAAHAMNAIKDLKKQDLKKQDLDGSYTSYVSGLPATIVMNGLGQALAMELAKSEGKPNAHFYLYKHLANWLMREVVGVNSDEPKTGDFLKWLMDQDQRTYVRAQTEAMAYLNWLKQFARAFLEEK